MSDSSSEETTAAEVATLAHRLHEIDRRLQALGGGAVDGVLSPAGQFYLLRQAQLDLQRSESEQRALATELLVEQRRLVEAQATARIGSWWADLATGAVEWSEEMYRIYALNRAEEGSLRRALEQYHPEDRARVMAVSRSSVFDPSRDGSIRVFYSLATWSNSWNTAGMSNSMRAGCHFEYMGPLKMSRSAFTQSDA